MFRGFSEDFKRLHVSSVVSEGCEVPVSLGVVLWSFNGVSGCFKRFPESIRKFGDDLRGFKKKSETF